MKKFRKIIFTVLILTIVLLPAVSLAQTNNQTSNITLADACGTGVSNIGNIICRIGFILNSIVPRP